MPKQVFIGGISRDTRERDVERLFEKYGDIERITWKQGAVLTYRFLKLVACGRI